MGSVIVGVIGSLLGVAIGVIAQEVQARRNRQSQEEDLAQTHRWQQQDSLKDTKRVVYAQYLRAIDASYAQATSGQSSRSEDANILAAAAEIEMLSGPEVSKPARELAMKVIDTHSRIAVNAELVKVLVPDVDHRRYQVIDLFKTDLGIKADR